MIGVAVCDVQHHQIGAGLQQRAGPVELSRRHPDGRADAQPALGVPCSMRVFLGLRHIPRRDEPDDPALPIHHRQLLQAVFVQDRLRFLV